MAALLAATRFIGDHPDASPRTTKRDMRVNVLRRYAYKIYYRAIDETVEIIHIRHTARRPWVGLR
jgi:toxin ParE1/3/4